MDYLRRDTPKDFKVNLGKESGERDSSKDSEIEFGQKFISINTDDQDEEKRIELLDADV